MKQIVKELGQKDFDKFYNYLKQQRSRPQVNEEAMHNEIKKAVKSNKQKMAAIFKLDGIVFNEIIAAAKINK